MTTTTTPLDTTRTRVTDSSGFRVFSQGDAGAAHAMAHRMLDEGRLEEGRRSLGAWIECHDGSGSKWAHLQWHMAVFEIAAGRNRDALERFVQHILPVVELGEAHTDGPSLLWRLCLSSGGTLDLDWGPVHDEAAASVSLTDDPFVELHHTLALAGAGDLATVDRWLDAHYSDEVAPERRLLLQVVWGLRSFASGDYAVAAALLDGVVGNLGAVGGSRAQNDLFAEIAAEAMRRAGDRPSDRVAA
jgi:hypothetical protein